MIARSDLFALAPELMNGSRQPDPLSDAFSLAVVIYGLLKTTHPFGGDGLQSDIENKWVDDPSRDTADKLVPTELVLTKEMRRLFTQCFIDGRESRFARPSCNAWMLACQSSLDRTVACGACNSTLLVHSSIKQVLCPFCGEPQADLAALEFFDAVVDDAAQPSRTILRYSGHSLTITGGRPVDLFWRHCLSGQPDGDSDRVLARLLAKDGAFAIENASSWPFFVFQLDSNRSVAVPPGGNSAFPVKSRILFDRPQPNRTVKGARFVRCGGIK
jgi:hypothetical protein